MINAELEVLITFQVTAKAFFQGNKIQRKGIQEGILKAEIERQLGTQVRGQDNPTPKGYSPLTLKTVVMCSHGSLPTLHPYHFSQ